MKRSYIGLALLGASLIGYLPSIAQVQNNVFSGTVGRVWEDGFRLDTGDRSVTVDSWDVCGDNTPRSISTGDQVTVTGEFDEGEFDAFSIVKTDGTSACSGED
ncbi:MAG: hypothetical protein F6K31_01625 [Symploca sp. SIO2G7]|nr:hypothetical protein [Symploca sp. SIO2G7]